MSAGREVAQRIDTLSSDLAQARGDTREALAAQAQAGRLGELEDTVRETQSQYHALQQAWQNFNDSASDELLANDVERLLTLANQQLRLAGNVSNAIVALETAQARLARADRPRFSSLQQAINGDLDRLRAVSTVDIPAQAARIERLSVLISGAAAGAGRGRASRGARRQPWPPRRPLSIRRPACPPTRPGGSAGAPRSPPGPAAPARPWRMSWAA